jgi:hypothetical protein
LIAIVRGPMAAQSGNSKRHLLRKLKRARRKDLVGAVERGEVTAYQAAVEAGIRRRRRPLEVDGNVAKRRDFRRHPARAERDLEMWLGPTERGSVFASERQQRAYWRESGERIMVMIGGSRRRPWAWWRYEAKLAYPGIDRERSVLFVEGLLGEAEARELLAFWRAEFERAMAPDFVFHWRGRVLRAAAARRAHYSWADIPLEEAVAWTKERRRSARAIRAMAPAA